MVKGERWVGSLGEGFLEALFSEKVTSELRPKGEMQPAVTQGDVRAPADPCRGRTGHWWHCQGAGMAGRHEYRARREQRLRSEPCESGGSAQTATHAAGEPWDWVYLPVDVQAAGSDLGGVRRAGRRWLWVACRDQRGEPEPGTGKTALALGLG